MGSNPTLSATAVDYCNILGGKREKCRDGHAPASTGMPWLTWDQSARQLLAAVIDDRWYRVLPGTLDEGAP